MATAGSIVVDLLMKTGSFETDSKRAAQRLKEIEKAAQQWGKRLGGAAVVAGTAFAAWTVHVAKTGVEIENLSRIAGASTDAFQRMAYGAKTYGIEQDKLSDQLKDFNEKVGEYIQSGGGGMKDFFEQIAPRVGVTVDQFRRLSGPEGLQLYYDSLEKAGLNQKQMSFYLEAMASDTTALIPLLQNGGSEMRRLGDEAERFGAVMDDRAIAAARELDRSLDRLQAMLSGLSTTLANQTLPVLNAFIENAIEASTETDGILTSARDLAADRSLPSWIDAVGIGLARVADVAVALGRVIAAVHSSFKAVSADVDLASQRYGLDMDMSWLTSQVFEGVEENNDALKNALEARNKIVEEANKKWTDLWTYEGDTFEKAWMSAVEKLNFDANFVGPMPPIVTFGDGDTGGGTSVGKAKVDKDPLGTFITAQNIDFAMDQYQSYLDFVDEITGRTARQQIEQQREWLSDALRLGNITYTEYEKAMDQLAKKSQDTMSQVDEFTLQAARNIQDSLGDGLYSLLSGNFDDIGAKFGDMVMRMAADAAAANIAGALLGDYGKTGQIGGLLGSIATSLFNPTGVGWSMDAGSAAAIGWDTGGYTGPGGRFEPKGIVHAEEGVLNRDEIRAIGGEAGFNALRRAIRGARHAIGGMGGRPALPPGVPAMAGAPQPMKLEIINPPGIQLRGRDGGMSFNGKEYVQTVILEDIRNDGPIAQTLRGGQLRGRR